MPRERLLVLFAPASAASDGHRERCHALGLAAVQLEGIFAT